MADIHDGPQFTFCHSLTALRCFDAHKAEYQHGKVIDDEDDRSQRFHQKPDDIAESQGNFFCAQGCHGFRGNLTEDQDQHCQNSGCDSGTGVAEDTEGKCCSQGRCRQVDNIITNQDCTQHFRRIIGDLKHPGGTLVPFFCQRSHADPVYRGQCRFR